MGADRCIACVRIPDLPVQAELARRRQLQGRPFVVTSGASTSAGVVIGCSPEGRAHGLYEGMPVREVPALCRTAILVPADPEYYQAIHRRVADALEEWVPVLEEGELGIYFTDLTGMEGLYPRLEALLDQLKDVAAAVGLRAGAGAGPNKFVASVAAHAAGGGVRIVLAQDAAAFLAPHSIHHLPVSEETAQRLRLFGLNTLGDVARLAREALTAQFGQEGRWAWELAQGIDHSLLVPRRPFRPIEETLLFPAPVGEWGPFWAGIQQLLARLWQRKERGGATVRQLEFIFRFAEERWEKRITLSEPVGRLDRLEAMLKRRLEGLALPGAVDALTIKFTLLGGPYVAQESLFAERAQRMEKIKEALARIKARHGTTGLYRIAEVEPWSRIPERRYALISFDP